MIDARLPWLAASSSRISLEGGSSTSVLHSIYGSQVSQLQFTDSDSEASLLVVEDDVKIRRQTRRPKSSPAFAYVNREQQKQKALSRPGSALTQVNLPQRSCGPQRRQLQRPSSAMPSYQLKTAAGRWRRPGSAASMVRPSSATPKTQLGSSTSLVQLSSLRETPPVGLSSTPQYFGFWSEKPLLRKEFVVPVHKRMAWRRPKSGRGSQFQVRGAGKGGSGGGAGLDNEGSLLSTLDEIDSLDESAHGRKLQRSGHSGEGTEREGENGEDQLAGNKLGRGGGDGSGDGDGEHDTNWRLRVDPGTGKGGQELTNEDESQWGRRGDMYGEEGDQYFSSVKLRHDSSWLNSSLGGSTTTHFKLPVDLQILERMAPADYLHVYCRISQMRNSHYGKVFSQLNRDKDRRITVKELQHGLVVAHYHCLSPEQAHSVVELMELDEGVMVDQQLFGAACVLAERIFPKCLPHAFSKEVIEVADFQALEWKLRNCSISNSLHILLAQL